MSEINTECNVGTSEFDLIQFKLFAPDVNLKLISACDAKAQLVQVIGEAIAAINNEP